MVARHFGGLQVVFSAPAQSALARLPADARNRVIDACAALAELAAVAPLDTDGRVPPLLSSLTDDVELFYEVDPEQRALLVKQVVSRA